VKVNEHFYVFLLYLQIFKHRNEKNLVLPRSLYEYIQRAFLSDNCIVYKGRFFSTRAKKIVDVTELSYLALATLFHSSAFTLRCIVYVIHRGKLTFCPIQACHCPFLGGQHFCVPLLWRGPVRPPISHPTWKPQGCPRDQLIRPVISAVVS